MIDAGSFYSPTKLAIIHHFLPYEETKHLSESIQTGQVLNLSLHEVSIQNALQKKRDIEKGWEQDTFSLLDRFSDNKKTMYFKKNEQLLLRLALCCSFRRKSF